MNTKLPKKIYLNYCDENCDSSNYDDLSGITWCSEPVTVSDCDMKNREYIDLSQVWHDASEEPLKDRVFLTELGASEYGFHTFVLVQNNIKFNWSEWVKAIRLLRWAYVSDLLPKIEEL